MYGVYFPTFLMASWHRKGITSFLSREVPYVNFLRKSWNRTLGIIQQIQMMIMCTDTEIKVKINMSLCLKSQHHTLKIYWKMQLYAFLTLLLDGGDRSPSWHSHLTPEEGVPSIHWTGCWLGNIYIGHNEKEKISTPTQNQTTVIRPINKWLYCLNYLGSVFERYNGLKLWNKNYVADFVTMASKLCIP